MTNPDASAGVPRPERERIALFRYRLIAEALTPDCDRESGDGWCARWPAASTSSRTGAWARSVGTRRTAGCVTTGPTGRPAWCRRCVRTPAWSAAIPSSSRKPPCAGSGRTRSRRSAASRSVSPPWRVSSASAWMPRPTSEWASSTALEGPRRVRQLPPAPPRPRRPHRPPVRRRRHRSLHRLANGLPRALNVAATAALIAAACERKALVDDNCAKRAASELAQP
jgi:hypothetical protein